MASLASNSELGLPRMLRVLRRLLELPRMLLLLTVGTSALFWLIIVLICYFSAAARSNVIRGPDPNLLREGTVPLPPYPWEPLYLPGTDDEEEQVQEGLVTGETAFLEDDGTSNNLPGSNDDVSSPVQDGGMEIDGGDPQSSDEAPSPLPTKTARRLRQEPKISFVFDDVTGDFVESYPTIFLPRPAVPPSQGSQGTKSDATKKRKKNAKGKDKKAETAVPRKRSRDDNDDAPTVAKPASKKLKSNDHKVPDDKGVTFSGIFVL